MQPVVIENAMIEDLEECTNDEDEYSDDGDEYAIVILRTSQKATRDGMNPSLAFWWSVGGSNRDAQPASLEKRGGRTPSFFHLITHLIILRSPFHFYLLYLHAHLLNLLFFQENIR